MIAVQRAPTPPVLKKLAKRWTQALAGATTDDAKKRAEGRYKHREIKDALRRMFKDKCAYCESYLRHISYGEIEHFRPKSRYRRHVFTWSNLLLACGVCNGPRYKRDKFPTKRTGGPLVNPCQDDPRAHFEFKYDTKTKLATVVPRTTRGATTERDLGLNRNPGLREHRSRQVARALALSLAAARDTEARALFEELRARVKDGSEEYSAFLRACLTP